MSNIYDALASAIYMSKVLLNNDSVDTDDKKIRASGLYEEWIAGNHIVGEVYNTNEYAYLGEQWIEGAREFLSAVEAAGKRYVFLTNNSSKNPQVYVKKLSRMGLEVTEEKIVTSGQATIAYLKQHFPGKRVFLLGNELLTEEFVQEGIVLDTE